MKVAIYARVSTRDKGQNPEVQLEPLRKYCEVMQWEVYREYVDKCSAADIVNRVAWEQLLKDASVHKFDILLIWKLDRAFRSNNHASNTLTLLNSYRVGFRSLMDAAIDTTTPNGVLVFGILSCVAQFEKDLDSVRILEGIDYAKKHGTKSGKPFGRPRINISDEDVLGTLARNNGNFSTTAKSLSGQFNVKVSPGFVATRQKRALQTSGLKTGILETQK
jgi:DNA invertase Pin-like site-specific DNA recombinase